MKKKLLPISLLCLVGMILAGCGGSKSSNSQAPVSSSGEPSSVVPSSSSVTPVPSSSSVAPSSSSVAPSSSSSSTPSSSSAPSSSSSSVAPQPVAVTGVALDKTAANVILGQTLQLTATVSPENADNKAVTWSSSDPDVASVSNGLVTAEGIGEATITVKTREGNKTATCVITVVKEIEKIEITNKSAFEGFIVDDMESINVDVTPADNVTALLAAGALKATSSDPTVASVVGLTVTALKAGTTKITVQLFGKEDSFDLTVGEAIPGTPYTVANALVKGFEEAPWNGNTGKTGAITTTCFELTGVILAVSENGATGYNAILDDGTGAVYLQISKGKDDPIPFAAGDYAKVTCKFINYYGLLEGVARKAATGDNASWIPAKDAEKIAAPETPITPSLNEAVAMTGDEYTAYYNVCKTNGTKGDANASYTLLKYVILNVEYSQEFKDADKGGYKINKDYGLAPYGFEMDEPFDGQKSTVKAFLIGANTGKGKSNAIVMEQTPLAVESVAIDQEAQTIVHGTTLQLTYTTQPAGSYSREVLWTSDAEANATVDEKGLVTGVYVGDGTQVANIKVKLGSGDNAKESTAVAISVFGEDVAATAVELAATANCFVGGKVQLTATPTPAMVSDIAVWSSDDETVAKVDQKGLVQGLKEGTANITVKYNDSVSATCAVTVSWEKGVRESDPISADEAIALGNVLANKATTENEYYIKGFISEYLWDNFDNPDKNNATFWLASSTASQGFEVYSAKADANLVKDNVKVGAEVLVKSKITKYNTTIETVSNEGVILSATYEDHATTAIALDKATADMVVGDELTLKTTFTPFYSTDKAGLEWGSDNAAVASVSKGKVTALRPGTAKIFAKLGDLVQSCTVTVAAPAAQLDKVAEYDFSKGNESTSEYKDAAGLTDLAARFTSSAVSGEGLSNIVTGATQASKAYAGYSGYLSLGMKFGTGSANGSFTVSLSKNVSRVVVKAAGWSATDTLKVGDAEAQTPGVAYNGTDPVKTLTFNITASNSVKFEFAKRGFIQSIEFYAEGAAADPVAQPTGAFHGMALLAAGAFVPVDLTLTEGAAELVLNGTAVPVTSLTWDNASKLELVTAEASGYGTITAYLEGKVLVITDISGAARAAVDMSYVAQISGNCQFIDCSVMTLDQMNEVFVRRYDSGSGWQINKPSDARISVATADGRTGLQCNGYSGGKVGLTLKADLAQPIPGTAIKSIGCWIYNPGTENFTIRVFAYKSANRATNGELGSFTVKPGWHFYQMGVVNGKSFTSADSFYNFQFYYEKVSVNPIFDDLCIYM